MKFYKLKLYGKTFKVYPVKQQYGEGKRLAIPLITDKGEVFSILTTNLPDQKLSNKKNCAFVDTNNNEFAEQFIQENNLGEPTGLIGYSGFCFYPEYRFDLSKLYEEENID